MDSVLPRETRIRRSRSRAAAGNYWLGKVGDRARRDRVGRGRVADAVDDVVDRAGGERDGEDVVQPHPAVRRRLETVGRVHGRVRVEVAVTAQAPGLVA